MGDRKTVLKIDHVNKQYMIDGVETDILKNINLEIRENEFISIVGFSGCGKSTLLKLILGLEPVTSGTISINGEKVNGPKDACGMIFQESRLCGWKNVSNNIRFGIRKKMPREEQNRLIKEQLKLVDLEKFARAYPKQLSGGMQQRVSIVRALISDPQILLLDEPFGALDAFTRINMQKEITRIWQEQNKTMILVTHDIDEAIYLSDRIIVLSQRPGQIQDIINVPLARPRNRSDDDFLRIRKQIYLNFWGETKDPVEYYI